jgi:ribonuclease HI
MEDHVAWHFDSKGIFSVKSAYKMYALYLNDDRQAGTSSGSTGSEREKTIWKQMWNLECPPKVHHFLWRVGRDSLPTRMNIQRRHVDLDTRCAVCNTGFENGGHLFVTCAAAKKAWRALSLEDARCVLLNCGSGLELLERILAMPYERKMKCVAFLWCWWTERNKANRGERRLSISELQFTVCMHAEEWMMHLKKEVKQTVNKIHCWQPPPVDWVLLNSDGAFVPETGLGGWGAVARDNNGDMIVAEAGSVPFASDAMHTETYALMKAIELATRLGFGRIILATDCQTLQRAVSSTEYDLSQLGVLFREAKFQLSTEFIEHKIVHVPRSCNKPAHVLAAMGLAGVPNDHQIWLEQVPVDVSRALYGDSAVEC